MARQNDASDIGWRFPLRKRAGLRLPYRFNIITNQRKNLCTPCTSYPIHEDNLHLFPDVWTLVNVKRVGNMTSLSVIPLAPTRHFLSKDYTAVIGFARLALTRWTRTMKNK